MIYEFGMDLRVKGLLLSDLKPERDLRILMEMEFQFKDNYDLKVSQGLKKQTDPLIPSNSLIKSGINIRKKQERRLGKQDIYLLCF